MLNESIFTKNDCVQSSPLFDVILAPSAAKYLNTYIVKHYYEDL